MSNAEALTALPAISAPALTDIVPEVQSGTTYKATWNQVSTLFQETPNPTNVQTGTSYTLAATDNGKVIVFTNSSAVTITLPQQSDVALPVGFTCGIRTAGTGAGTFAVEGSDVKVGNNGTGASAANDAVVVLRQTVSTVNTFDIFGGV